MHTDKGWQLNQSEINPGRTLLLVDDEEYILASLKRLLRRDGYQIFTASSAQQGYLFSRPVPAAEMTLLLQNGALLDMVMGA